MNTRNRVTIGVLVATAVLLLGAGMAWACTSQARVSSVTPDEAPAGSTASVNGERFVPGNTIEIRWDSRTGTKLGEATGPKFSERVTIPDVEPGHYVIVAVDSNGQWSARHSFTVTDPDAGSGASGRTSGSGSRSPNGSGDTSATTSGGANSEPQSSTDASSNTESSSNNAGDSTSSNSSSSSPSSSGSSSQSSGASGSALPGPDYSQSPESAPQGSASSRPSESNQAVGEAGRSPNASGQEANQSVGQPTDTGADEPQPQRVGSGQATQPASGQPASQPDDSRSTHSKSSPDKSPSAQSERAEPNGAQRVDAEGAATEGRDDRQAAGGDRTGRPDTDAATSSQDPSARTGVGDLWSGFDAGDGEASLTPSVDGSAADATESGARQLTLALGLVGAGLLVLMSGAFVGVARRRALATAGTRPRLRG